MTAIYSASDAPPPSSKFREVNLDALLRAHQPDLGRSALRQTGGALPVAGVIQCRVARRAAQFAALSLLAFWCAWAARAVQRDLATRRDLHGAAHGGAAERTRRHPDPMPLLGRVRPEPFSVRPQSRGLSVRLEGTCCLRTRSSPSGSTTKAPRRRRPAAETPAAGTAVCCCHCLAPSLKLNELDLAAIRLDAKWSTRWQRAQCNAEHRIEANRSAVEVERATDARGSREREPSTRVGARSPLLEAGQGRPGTVCAVWNVRGQRAGGRSASKANGSDEC